MEPHAVDPNSSPPVPLDGLEEEFETLGLEFLARFLGEAVERRPELTEALADLGHVYTRLGRFREGLAVDRRLAALFPDDPIVHYNLACSLSLLGECEEALESLERSFSRGYVDAAFMLADEDLAELRSDPRFHALARRMERAARI